MRLAFVRESDLDHTGDAMTSAIFIDSQPMTEAEFLALGETAERIELFDGNLHVAPNPTYDHQGISRRLANFLEPGAEAAGLRVEVDVNIRLRTNRILIPDVVIASGIRRGTLIADAPQVRLVCEVISPSSASTDKVFKMHHYAAAAIPWYLLVEEEAAALHLYQLVDSAYTERSVTRAGEILHLTDPVVATIDTGRLLPPE
jgi:Uma2 family endonuclease